MVDVLMRNATGTVGMKLYKGSAVPVTRSSPRSLYDEELASFGESGYDHADAHGFIKLFGLPTRTEASRRSGENVEGDLAELLAELTRSDGA